MGTICYFVYKHIPKGKRNPRKGCATEKFLGEYRGLFTRAESNEVAGIVCASYFLMKYHLGMTGYSFLLNANNQFIYHPMRARPQYLKKDKVIANKFLKKYKETYHDGKIAAYVSNDV